MKFSVFTASTPQWTPAEAAKHLAEQGWDGIEWRVTDQEDAPEPGFWAGNRSTWPLTGLEERLPEIARITREAGLDFSGIGGYARCHGRSNVERLLQATAALRAGRVRVTMPGVRDGHYRELFRATRPRHRGVPAGAARVRVRRVGHRGGLLHRAAAGRTYPRQRHVPAGDTRRADVASTGSTTAASGDTAATRLIRTRPRPARAGRAAAATSATAAPRPAAPAVPAGCG